MRNFLVNRHSERTGEESRESAEIQTPGMLRRAPLSMTVLNFALMVLLSGCASPPGVLFPPLEKPVVFPPPPELTHVAYVGQLSTSADLKAPVPFGQGIGDAIFGRKKVASMLSP